MKISIDTEASGPAVMLGDVISFGAVVIEPGLTRTFRSPDMKPMFDKYVEDAYRSIKINREIHLAYPGELEDGFRQFSLWLNDLKKGGDALTMTSDNPAFDWQWINWGLHYFTGSNPLGFSARRIGDMFAGLTNQENNTSRWKKFRKTKHTHDPLDDAIGNAEAYLHIWRANR